MALSDFPTPYDLCNYVLVEVNNALVACGRGVTTEYVLAGELAWDDCCGTLVVSPARIFQSADFPNEGPDATGCYTGSLVVETLVQLVRCVPVISDTGVPPPDADMDAAYRLILGDAATVFNTLYRIDLRTAGISQAFVGAEGGCVTVETRTLIGLDCELWATCPPPEPVP